jgi:hypothetical protein
VGRRGGVAGEGAGEAEVGAVGTVSRRLRPLAAEIDRIRS